MIQNNSNIWFSLSLNETSFKLSYAYSCLISDNTFLGISQKIVYFSIENNTKKGNYNHM